MSNVGKWESWFSIASEPEAFGDSPSYELIAEHLGGCATVEDWGCGKGWLRQFFEPGRYVGVDGSRSRFADVVVDLVEHDTKVDGIALRHVLEHDYRWHLILENALRSCGRLAVVLFTPVVPYTCQFDFEDPPGVPVLSFRLKDLTDRFKDFGFEHQVTKIKPSPTQFAIEHVILGVRE